MTWNFHYYTSSTWIHMGHVCDGVPQSSIFLLEKHHFYWWTSIWVFYCWNCFLQSSIVFYRLIILFSCVIFRWKPDGQIISLPTFGSSRRSVLTCGTVSSDWPRDITRIEGNLKTAEYLRILNKASDGNYGRNVAHLSTPVHRSRAVAEWFSSGRLNCLPWPKGSQDIFPLTTMWKYFLLELRLTADVVGNTEKLWGEIYECWLNFMQNDTIIDAVTSAYLWVDISNIAEKTNEYISLFHF